MSIILTHKLQGETTTVIQFKYYFSLLHQLKNYVMPSLCYYGTQMTVKQMKCPLNTVLSYLFVWGAVDLGACNATGGGGLEPVSPP